MLFCLTRLGRIFSNLLEETKGWLVNDLLDAKPVDVALNLLLLLIVMLLKALMEYIMRYHYLLTSYRQFWVWLCFAACGPWADADC